MASLIKPSHKGLLHKELGVKQGKKIGAKKLATALTHAKKTHNVTEEKRIVFAQNFGHKHDPGNEPLPTAHTSKHH